MNRLLTLNRLIALATALLGATLLGCNDSASNAAARYVGQAAAVPVMTVPAQLADLRETLTSLCTYVHGFFAPSPRSSADSAEAFRVCGSAPSSRCLQVTWRVEREVRFACGAIAWPRI